MTHTFRRGQSLVVMAAICILLDAATLRADQRDLGIAGQVLTDARFAVILDGVEIASFARFDSTVDPASASARVITLSGGLTYSPELAAWHELVLGNIDTARKNCAIVMLTAGGSPIVTYNIVNAWPQKYTGVGLKQHRSEAVILAYDSVEVRVHD